MAKDGAGSSSGPSEIRSGRKGRPAAAGPVELRRDRASHPPAPDTALGAAGEKSQLEFQRIFGINLKAARLKANLKQSDVAALTGLPQQYISLIEAGQQNVTIKTMALLAKVVDHDLLDLLREVLGTSRKAR